MDGVILLPLVVLGIERLFDEQRLLPYVIPLSLAFITTITSASWSPFLRRFTLAGAGEFNINRITAKNQSIHYWLATQRYDRGGRAHPNLLRAECFPPSSAGADFQFQSLYSLD